MSTTAEEAALVHHEIIEAGSRIYDEQLKDRLELEHTGRFVAIEPESGRYFLGDTDGDALYAAHKAMPDSRFFVRRIGYYVTHRLGSYGTRRR